MALSFNAMTNAVEMIFGGFMNLYSAACSLVQHRIQIEFVHLVSSTIDQFLLASHCGKQCIFGPIFPIAVALSG